MKAEKDDGCSCPRCQDHIPEQFTAATAATCRSGGRARSMRHVRKQRRRELKNRCGCQNVEAVVKEQSVA